MIARKFLPLCHWNTTLGYVLTSTIRLNNVIVQGGPSSHSLLGWNPSWLKYIFILFNQSFYVKEYIIGHKTQWPCILVVVLRGLKLVLLCMFELSSIMSYTIYHAVLILFCFDHDHCVMLECIMLLKRINILKLYLSWFLLVKSLNCASDLLGYL